VSVTLLLCLTRRTLVQEIQVWHGATAVAVTIDTAFLCSDASEGTHEHSARSLLAKQIWRREGISAAGAKPLVCYVTARDVTFRNEHRIPQFSIPRLKSVHVLISQTPIKCFVELHVSNVLAHLQVRRAYAVIAFTFQKSSFPTARISRLIDRKYFLKY
jgi:hypothetical protein